MSEQQNDSPGQPEASDGPDASRPRLQVPSHLFRGRVRTTTLVMCVLWLGMWVTYLILNQPDDHAQAPQQAVLISDTPYVPYVPAESTTHAPAPPTTSGAPTPTTSGTPTSPGPGAPGSTSSPTTDTTGILPFELPEIPGMPGFDGGNDSETGEDSGQTGESTP